MRTILILGFLALAACVSTSEVMPMADGAYFVESEDRLIFKTRTSIMEDAMERATEFCAAKDKVAIMVSQDSKGAPGWSGAASGIVFRCVDKQSAPVGQ